MTCYIDLVPLFRERLALSKIDAQRIWDWSLTLWAMGIDHLSRQEGAGPCLLVSLDDRDRAVQEISCYELENKSQGLQRTESMSVREQGSAGMESTLWAMFALGLFHLLTISNRFAGIDWIARGGLEPAKVLAGQWWRLLTGLFLHADLAHLLGNVLFAFIFISILAREMGPALTWCLLLSGSVLANYCSVLIKSDQMMSIGFSTAVFNALGILTGRRMVGVFGQHRPFRSLVVPLGSGMGLLAFLGTAGKHTDLVAHFCGFAMGMLIGWIFYPLPPLRKGVFWGGGCVVICAYCWLLALRQ